MDEACTKALQHVHNGTDTENQWRRAVQCLRTMDELRVALAWQRLSAPLQTRITLSQYKMLFKCALRAAGREAEKEKVVVTESPVDDSAFKHREEKSKALEGSDETPSKQKDETQSKMLAEFKQTLKDMASEVAQLTQENERLHQYKEESRRLKEENRQLKNEKGELQETRVHLTPRIATQDRDFRP